MKKFVLFTAIIISVLSASAQECKLKGVVRYEYNDYIGFKTDSGAEVYVVPSNTPDLDITTWDSYAALAKEYMKYLEAKSDPDIPNNLISLFSDWKDSDKVKLDELDSKCLDQYLKMKDNCIDIGLVDESGKYELVVPYGEYYILFVSKNRERPTVTELTGRKIVEKVTIDKPVKVLSIDFKY